MDATPMDDRVIKTYVWHGAQCFFVSTIERESSAMEGPRRYNETMVWPYDWQTAKRGENFIHQDGDTKGSIEGHIRIVRAFREHGKIIDQE